MIDLIERALAEDVGEGDVTTMAVVPAGARAHARIEQREPGVPAGLALAAAVFLRTGPDLELDTARRRRGVAASPVCWRRSRATPARSCAPSGWRSTSWGGCPGWPRSRRATCRRSRARACGILDTRKTTPGLRALEKEAVRAGGGSSHRAGLHDAILVKENHSALAGGVGEASRRALASAPEGVPVEVECATLAEVEEALAAGVPRLLLDNMSPAGLREAVELVAGRASLEASGGITLATVRAVAESGVDFISVGALTHSAAALDVSLLLEPA